MLIFLPPLFWLLLNIDAEFTRVWRGENGFWGCNCQSRVRHIPTLRTIALHHYPSIDILIPAYNEGKVIRKTLEAMLKLQYPGNLQIYVLNDNSQDTRGKLWKPLQKSLKIYIISGFLKENLHNPRHLP